MNAHSRIKHETIVNMTSKGQVLIPKAIRDSNGLAPGKPVRIGLNEDGETVVLPYVDKARETPEERRERILKGLEALRGKYSTGQTTEEYMRWLRGDWEP